MQKWHALLAPVLDEFVKSAAGNADIDFWDRVASHDPGLSGPSYVSGWATAFAVFTTKGKWQGDLDKDNRWPRIDTDDLPLGVLSVPVTVNDNGTIYNTHMLAGQFAYEGQKDNTAVQPRTDWLIGY